MNRRQKRQSNRNRNGRANTSAANPEGSASRRKLLLPTAIVVLIVVGFVAFYKQPAPQRGTLTSAHEKASGLATNGGAGSSGTRMGSDIVSTNAFNHPQEEETISDPEIAVHLLNQGNELLNQERTEEAVETFRRALEHDPGSEDTHYNIAIALARLGREGEAIVHYEETLRIFPDYAEAHNNLGNLLVKQSKFAEAIKHFDESLEINPDSASTRNNIGKALALQGKITEATLHFAKAAQMIPDYLEAHYNLGNAYFALGRTDEAIAEFTTALKLQPGFVPAVQALTKAQQKRALQSPR